jgi:hypothetical protein
MMKKTSLVLFFIAVFATMSAQTPGTAPKVEKDHHMGLDVAVGYSLVMGSYAAYDNADKKSGYASGGYLVQVTFDWMGKKDFGMAFQYSYQHNPLKDTASHVLIDGLNNIPMGPGTWSNHYLMVGPVFMKSIGKLYLDAKIMGGVVLAFSPVFYTADPTDTLRLKYSKNTGTGFAWQVSAAVGYNVSAHLSFKFSLGLMGGWPVGRKSYPAQLIGYEKVKDPITGIIYEQPVYSPQKEYEIKKVITTVNPSIGLVYRF